MSSFVLIGGPFEIYDTEFQGDSHSLKCTLGSAFEMPEELATAAVKHGAALLPKEHFAALGFTEDELKKYPNARLQAGAPDAFKAKLLAARIAVHDYRADLYAQEG